MIVILIIIEVIVTLEIGLAFDIDSIGLLSVV